MTENKYNSTRGSCFKRYHKWQKKMCIIFNLAMTAIACLLLVFNVARDVEAVASPKEPKVLSVSSESHPLPASPLIYWNNNLEAVYYELEFFDHIPEDLSPTQNSGQAMYYTHNVYRNYYNPDLKAFAQNFIGKCPIYWRVRAMAFDGTPISSFSSLQALYTDSSRPGMEAPIAMANARTEKYNPISQYDSGIRDRDGRGTMLLYPVYTWIGIAGASRYRVELYTENPQYTPWVQPVDTFVTPYLEIYDDKPRIGQYYWRVIGLDDNDGTVGKWSYVQSFDNSVHKPYRVAVLGDSISHGGGHYSFGPACMEYSWLSYLDFDAINLSQSGDTSAMTDARFERDVVPFSPKYLLIFTGTNSLRAGEKPENVISNLESIQKKCQQYGITPVFMTLPPINPANIQAVFNEPTAEDWKTRFNTVNTWIRSQVHIDSAALFTGRYITTNGELQTCMGMDGLHPDIPGKKLIADAVNASWLREELVGASK